MKLFLKVSFFVLSYLCMQQMILSSVGQCPSAVPASYAQVEPGSIVAAYFGNWDVYGAHSYKIDQINPIADHIDYLVYGFMKPDDKTARCKPHDIWADVGAYDDVQTKVGGNFAKIRDLKAKYPKLKVLLSIGGGTYNKNLFMIAQDKDRLMQFAKSCVDILDFYDHVYMSQDGVQRTNHLDYQGLFDGLDIDWEWTNSQMSDHMAASYTQFMQEISRLLKLRDIKSGKKSMLTMALQVTPKIYQTLQLAKIGQLVDYVHVMAYDFYGPSSGVVGFNAPICSAKELYSVDGALQHIMQQGISPAKLVLGLPLYGYVYEDSYGYRSTIKNSKQVKAVSYHLIKSRYLQNPEFKKGWNSYEKSASLYNPKEKIFVSYDNKDAIKEKVELAKYKKLAGVVAWRLSGDDSEHSVFKTIAKVMHETI